MEKIAGIYIFILLGFFFKKKFDNIDNKSFILLSIYILQPILMFWGLSLKPININVISDTIIFIGVLFLSLIVFYFLSIFFKNKKDKIIIMITPLLINTGNIGIPIVYYLYGKNGVFYASIINYYAAFFMFTIGIFFYSGKISIEGVKEIFKLPILWAGIISIVLNLNGIKYPLWIQKFLEMGAFTSIVMQLIILGIYISTIKFNQISTKLSIFVLIQKFVIIPLIMFIVLQLLNINEQPILFGVLFIITTIPIAINNVNLSALYNNKPQEVTWLVVLTTLIYITLFPIFKIILNFVF